MDLKKRIINNHLFFRRITQEGGYYMNSVMNQSVLTDLPNFYNEFEEKINNLINQLNTNGKKVSEKSKENINKFLHELKRKEQQLETLSLSLNSISLDKNFTNRIITMDDVMRYADNLKGHQLKGYDIVESLKKYVIDSEKKLEPLTTEPLTTEPLTTKPSTTELNVESKSTTQEEEVILLKEKTEEKQANEEAQAKEAKEAKEQEEKLREEKLREAQAKEAQKLKDKELIKKLEQAKAQGVARKQKQKEQKAKLKEAQEKEKAQELARKQAEEEKAQEQEAEEAIEQYILSFNQENVEPETEAPEIEGYTKDDANILATPESDLKKVNEKVNEINILDELLNYLNDVKEINDIEEIKEVLKDAKAKSHDEIIDNFLKLLMNFNNLNKNNKNDIDLSNFIDKTKQIERN